MSPVLRRTWAPRGLTPTLAVRKRSHEKVSAIGALAVSPQRRRVSLYLSLHPRENIRGRQVLSFLRQLRRHQRGPLFLLWDRGNPHQHRLVRNYLDSHPQWHLLWLPPYAPELNPQEQVWTYLKYGRLANFAPDDVEQIERTLRRELRRTVRQPDLLKSFFRHCELPFVLH